MRCWLITIHKMHLSLVTVCSFLFYLPTNEARTGPASSMIKAKCKEFGLVSFISSVQLDILYIQKNGEVRIELGWECFPNKTSACFQRTEDCSKCDGEMIGESVDVTNEQSKVAIGTVSSIQSYNLK